MTYRSPDVAVQRWPVEALHGRAGGARALLGPLVVVFGVLLMGACFVATRLYVPESICSDATATIARPSRGR